MTRCRIELDIDCNAVLVTVLTKASRRVGSMGEQLLPRSAPFPLQLLRVKPEWLDFNGHMNDAAYAVAFSDALLVLTDHLGLDEAGRAAASRTIYTLAMQIRYLRETLPDARISLSGRVLESDEKRMRVWAEMRDAEHGTLLSTAEMLFVCIDQSGPSPRSAPWPEPFASNLAAMTRDHAALPMPDGAGEGIALRRSPTRPSRAPGG
jgi:acyl-CoA thioester hydrolase